MLPGIGSPSGKSATERSVWTTPCASTLDEHGVTCGYPVLVVLGTGSTSAHEQSQFDPRECGDLGGRVGWSCILSLDDDWEDKQPGTTTHQALHFSVTQQNKFLALLTLVWLQFCASATESILIRNQWVLPAPAFTCFYGTS